MKLEKIRNHPGIYKRGERYVVKFKIRGKSQTKTFRRLKEAVAFKHAVETDKARGEFRDVSRVSFEDYAGRWIDTYTGRTTRGFRESTRALYRREMESRAIPFFKGYRLAEIEPQDVKAFIAEMATEGIGVSTIRNHVAPVKALLGTAVEEGLLRSNPALGVRVSGQVAEQKEKPKALSREQLAALLAAVGDEWRPFFEFLVQTGLRIGEALEVRWADIEFGQPTRLHVRRQFYDGTVSEPKTSYGKRTIPLSSGVAQSLWARQGVADELVFQGVNGRLGYSFLRQRVLPPAAEAVGAPWVTLHTFRHTCASLLFSSGKNAKQVQLWLGHHDPGFTLRRYVHLMPEDLGGAECFGLPVGTVWEPEQPEMPGTDRNTDAPIPAISGVNSDSSELAGSAVAHS